MASFILWLPAVSLQSPICLYNDPWTQGHDGRNESHRANLIFSSFTWYAVCMLVLLVLCCPPRMFGRYMVLSRLHDKLLCTDSYPEWPNLMLISLTSPPAMSDQIILTVNFHINLYNTASAERAYFIAKELHSAWSSIWLDFQIKKLTSGHIYKRIFDEV